MYKKLHIIRICEHNGKVISIHETTYLTPKAFVKDKELSNGKWITSMLYDIDEEVIGFGKTKLEAKTLAVQHWYSVIANTMIGENDKEE